MKKFILITVLCLFTFQCEQGWIKDILVPPVEGCTDSSSCNYNSDAEENDGSCIAKQGCNGWCEGDSFEVASLDNCDTCDSDSDNITGSDNDSGTGSDDGGSEEVSPNLVLTDIDYVKDNPFGYFQFTSLRIQNTGDVSSLDYEYRIRPCISYTKEGFNQTFTYNFSEQYLPALSPGEYIVVQTPNELILYNNVSWWHVSGVDCTVIY